MSTLIRVPVQMFFHKAQHLVAGHLQMQGRCGHEMGGGSQQRDCTSPTNTVHGDGIRRFRRTVHSTQKCSFNMLKPFGINLTETSFSGIALF